MQLPKECLEVFLEDVIELLIYRKADCTIPMPPTIPAITELGTLTLGKPILHIAYNDTSNEDAETQCAVAEENSIIVKTTITYKSGLTLYNIEASATVDLGKENVQTAFIASDGEDCIIVAKRIDESLHLCHSLPHTFRMDIPSSGAHPVMSFKASAQAYSPFIDITQKEK